MVLNTRVRGEPAILTRVNRVAFTAGFADNAPPMYVWPMMDRSMPDLFLHNSLTRRKERFEPADPANIRMYVCGPTVWTTPTSAMRVPSSSTMSSPDCCGVCIHT